MRSLSVEESRNVDWVAKAQGHIPGIVLMENAGRGIAECLLKRKPTGTVVICCGWGNNGGDGLVIARHLDGAGIDVHVILFANPKELSGDAYLNYAMVAHSGIELSLYRSMEEEYFLEILDGAEWVIDALVGTGQTGVLRAPFEQAVRHINRAGKKILAVDVPSGMNADTGQPTDPTIRATLTVTMVTRKKGYDSAKARDYLGEVEVVGIGLPRKWQPS